MHKTLFLLSLKFQLYHRKDKTTAKIYSKFQRWNWIKLTWIKLWIFSFQKFCVSLKGISLVLSFIHQTQILLQPIYTERSFVALLHYAVQLRNGNRCVWRVDSPDSSYPKLRSCCPKSCSCLPIWYSCCTKSWIAVTYSEKLTFTLDLDYLFAYVGTAVIP